uniref:Uncharacterized protein n=2 Tax=Oncorhynchus TaxID=8016 RepID=A0AAZ3Q9P8_ONCTS
MGSKRYHSKTPGKLNYSLFCIGVCLIILLPLCDTFNLDVENPSVYSGPNGSYFGYSVEFYLTNSSRVPEWHSGLRQYISVPEGSLQTPWFESRLYHN